MGRCHPWRVRARRYEGAGSANFGLRAFGSILLIGLFLLVANGVTMFLLFAFLYCEHCAGQGLRLVDIIAFVVLPMPSAVTWYVLAQSDSGGNKRRWD